MDKLKKKPLVISRSTATDFDHADYHFSDKFETIRSIVRKRKFTVGSTEINYRVINHWDQNGILPEGLKSEGGEWRKFSFIELVWVEAVKKLREFGFSLDKIARVNEGVMRWNKENQTYSDFEYFVIKGWFSSMDPYILVLVDGEADIGSLESIQSSQLNAPKSMLLISVKSLLKDMGKKVQPAKILLDLTEEEIELLSKIRLENNIEVKARIADNRAITEIESSHIEMNPESLYEINKEIRDEGAYGSITTQFENGYRKSVKITKKRQFKK